MCHHFPHPPVIVPNPCDWVQGISSHLQWTIYHCNQIIMRAEIKNQTSLCYERIIQICCVNWILSVYLNYKSEITSKQILSWTLIMKPANQQFSVNLNYILVCSYKALECLQKTSNILLCFTEERSLFFRLGTTWGWATQWQNFHFTNKCLFLNVYHKQT